MVVNGVGEISTVWVFGGTSDLAIATVAELARDGIARVVLLCRDVKRADGVVTMLTERHPRMEVHVRPFDGSDIDRVPDVIARLTADFGDVDVAIVAHALLGADVDLLGDATGLRELGDVNYTGTTVVLASVARQMSLQKYGRLVLFSSVAGERVRRANVAYGASKAGIDAFAQGLDHVLVEHGASVLIVRPGFVRTKMTTGMADAPMSTTPEKVGRSVARAIRSRKRIIWVPAQLRWVFMVLRHLPTWLWRRLPV